MALTEKVSISLKKEAGKSYDIVVGEKLFPLIAKDLAEKPLGSSYVLLTDSNLKKLYAKPLMDELKAKGIEVNLVVYQAGEINKTRATKAMIEDKMFGWGLGRDSALIALGGGVCGDMGGFIAATYMRGIPVVQVATSTVAQTDSSVGGKTAIDVPAGKNLIGCFHQPSKVYIDVATLESLSERDYSSGLVELVKHGMIADKEFLDFFIHNQDLIMARKGEGYADLMIKLFAWNNRIKAKVVESDETEKGMRKVLNYGHTLAHSIEKLMNFKLTHGECVSIGIVANARLGLKLGFNSKEESDLQEDVLKKMGLPVRIPKELEPKAIVAKANLDKKARQKQAEYVLLETIGKVKDFGGNYATKISAETVEKVLTELKE